MTDSCYVYMKPTSWSQSISHYPSINVEGRQLDAVCKLNLDRDSSLRLSNKLRIRDLHISCDHLGHVRRRSAYPLIAEISLLGSEWPLCATFGLMHRSKMASSFYECVGAGLERQWHGQAKCFRGIQVDDKLEFGWLLDWQV